MFDLRVFAILAAILFALFIGSVIYKGMIGPDDGKPDDLPPPE